MDNALLEKSNVLTDSFRVINHQCFKCGKDVAKTIVYDNEMDGWSNNFLLCHLCKKRDEFYSCHDSQVLASDLLDFLTKKKMDDSEAKGDEFDPLIGDVTGDVKEPAQFSMVLINEGDRVEHSSVVAKMEDSGVGTDETREKVERKGADHEIDMDEVSVKLEPISEREPWTKSDLNEEHSGDDSRVNVDGIKVDVDFEEVDVPIVSPLSESPPSGWEKLNVDEEQTSNDCLITIAKEGTRFCMKCKKPLSTHAVISDHQVVCWKNSLFKCELCEIDMTYVAKSALAGHFHKSHKGMPLKYSIVRKDEVQNGLIKLDERILKCLKCLTLIPSENRRSHELTCLKNMSIHCIHCVDELVNFSSIHALRNHIKACHKNIDYMSVKHNIEEYCYE